MRNWCDIAQITNTKRLNGELVVQCTAGFPFILEQGSVVCVVPPPLELPRELTVEYIKGAEGASARVARGECDASASCVSVECANAGSASAKCEHGDTSCASAVSAEVCKEGVRTDASCAVAKVGYTSANVNGSTSAVVHFREITSANVAREYVGCHLLMCREEVKRVCGGALRSVGLSSLLAGESDIAGWSVRECEAGLVGRVSEIREMPGQMMLVVERELASNAGGEVDTKHDGEGAVVLRGNKVGVANLLRDNKRDTSSLSCGEILIPLVDEFIVSVDEKQKTLELTLPAGLLDL